MTVQAWLRQPTTITGLASVAGLALGAMAQWLTRDPNFGIGLGGAVFAAVHLVVNDNSIATDAQKLVADVVTQAPANTLVGDALHTVEDIAAAEAARK
jgi:uncharacterized membrane protein YhhN